MWSTLRNIPKFTTRSSIDIAIGKPNLQLEGRPVYDYDHGIIVHYSAMCFRIEGIERIEYGIPGEYAVGLFHYSNSGSLKKCMGKFLKLYQYPKFEELRNSGNN